MHIYYLLRNFLARHEHLHKGAVDCAKVGLWKCTQTLVRRNADAIKSIDVCTEVLSYVVKNGIQIWKTLNSTDRLQVSNTFFLSFRLTKKTFQVMSLVCHLDWTSLSDSDGARVCALLSAWQRDIHLPSYHEMCLRVALSNMDRFRRPCQILSLVSSVYILAEKKAVHPTCLPEFFPLSGGTNCGAAIAEDDRLMIWGNFTNAQQKLDVPQLGSKPKRSDSVVNGVNTAPLKPEQVSFLLKIRLIKLAFFSNFHVCWSTLADDREPSLVGQNMYSFFQRPGSYQLGEETVTASVALDTHSDWQIYRFFF